MPSIINLEAEKVRREIAKVNDRDWETIRDKLEDTMWKSGLPTQALLSATLNALIGVLDSDGMDSDEAKKRISETLQLFWEQRAQK